MKEISKRAKILFVVALALIGLLGGFLLKQDKSSNSSAYKYEGSVDRNSFGDNLSYSKIYHVSPLGSDDNDGITVNTPMLTIDKALSFTSAGDTIELADGDYYQAVSSVKNGQKDKPITIHGSQKAIIRGTESEGRIVEIKHDFITLDGFTIDGKSGDGSSKDDFRDKLLYVIGTEAKKGVVGLIVRNMIIQNAGGECVRFRYFAISNEISSSTIRNCGIYDFRFKGGGKNGEGIYIGTAPEQRKDGKNPTDDPDDSHSNHIHNNVIETYGNECVDIKEAASKNLIEHNTCQFQQDVNSAGFDARGSYNIFRNNSSKNNLGAGFRLGGDSEADGLYNDVYSNTTSNNKGGAIKIQRVPQGKICGNTIFEDIDNGNKASAGVKADSSCK